MALNAEDLLDVMEGIANSAPNIKQVTVHRSAKNASKNLEPRIRHMPLLSVPGLLVIHFQNRGICATAARTSTTKEFDNLYSDLGRCVSPVISPFTLTANTVRFHVLPHVITMVFLPGFPVFVSAFRSVFHSGSITL
jgi:hypothetical protein